MSKSTVQANKKCQDAVPHGHRRVTYVGNYGTIWRRFVGQLCMRVLEGIHRGVRLRVINKLVQR
ncbi:hypothetical protein SCLCIDRAFT_506048 [Scleroderma citrinum Foug A]|uniref:Uncharacterized protein n=1 Tax=Scleroderma citrinum Foug A TaxID=1036808 RepID=A0A0C3AYR6_9AGAM|nr:hypothetical protein SCLCIDRAFT_506048 [Scleroderma citrinum Foug A]